MILMEIYILFLYEMHIFSGDFMTELVNFEHNRLTEGDYRVQNLLIMILAEILQ